ncbi:MAG: hypothetical protein MR436_13320 [Eubacterium sp.]|nr:hypothetical protein [Eubacterium sp.]
MKKMKEKCMQIYEENKKIVYWYLKTKCTWLSDDEVHDVMTAVWKELVLNIDKVNQLGTKKLQAVWLMHEASEQAEKLKGRETNEKER